MDRLLKTILLLFLSLNIGICCCQLHFRDIPEPNWIDIGDLDIQGNQITLEALIYIEKRGLNIISKHMGPENVNYLFRYRSFGITTYQNGNSGPTDFHNLIVPFQYNFNQWYHIAGTYDGSSMKFYINGCKVEEIPAQGNLVQNDFATAIANRSGNTNEQFYGWMDEVRIWKVARTEQQIQANMMEVDLQPGLVGYYKFEGDKRNEIGERFHDGWRGDPGKALAIDSNPVTLFEEIEYEIIEPTCHGGSDGGILVTSGFDYRYSVTGVNFTDDKEFLDLKGGHYQLFIRSLEVCVIKDSIEITEPELINSTFSEEICLGDSIEFLGNLYNKAGTYIDTATAQNGCDSLIVFELKYTAEDFLGKDTSLCSAKPFTIKSPHPNTQWLGHPTNQNLMVNQSGLYIASYENDKGCTIKDSILVEFLDTIQYFIPNAFSPNDDGINDVFEPYFKSSTDFNLKVYDRWGNQLFNNENGWDGRMNGKRMNTGVYLWVLEMTRDACGTTEKILKSGEVSLFSGRN